MLHPFVMIQVGETKPVRVALDTGSTGLQLFSLPGRTQPASGVRCTAHPDEVEYGDPPHIRYTGQICTAYVTIGGVRTIEPVPFGLLTQESCPTAAAHCNVGARERNLAEDDYGVLGIALGEPKGLVNPLLAMAGGEGARYSVSLSNGGGTLGINVPEATTGSVFTLTRVGTGPLGLPTFNKSPRACVLIGGRQLTCLPTLFDTGQPWPTIYGGISGLPLSGSRVSRGTVLGFAPPGSSAAATSIDAATGSESPVTWSPADSPHANAGVESFLGKVFTFDPERGTITVVSAS